MKTKEFVRKHLWDGVLTLGLIALSCAVLAAYFWPVGEGNDVYAYVYVSAKIVRLQEGSDSIDLTKVDSGATYVIQGAMEGEKGLVTISVEPGRIAVKESHCPHQYCVKEGYISRPGQNIICAPNELLITLTGSTGEVWVG
ncbi:MAG: NusG domain II-containing protein [Bacilli bacterium]|jgi:hypothetical protein|nr:NusG domain II-containing protein [Bacilli bacterium]